jgi:hypothetical protein
LFKRFPDDDACLTPTGRRSGQSSALVLFKDPLAPQDTLQLGTHLFKSKFDNTVTDNGRAIAQIGARRGVLESTMKTQLKAISS